MKEESQVVRSRYTCSLERHGLASTDEYDVERRPSLRRWTEKQRIRNGHVCVLVIYYGNTRYNVQSLVTRLPADIRGRSAR